MGFLEALKAFVDTMGATVLLPVFIFIFAIALGTKVGRAFRSAVVIGVAFVGINLVIGLMLTSVTDVSQAMVQNLGIQRDIIDVGWPSAAAIAFGSSVGLWVIPLALAVNVLMLVLRLTKTLNIDVWNYWHFAFAGSLVVAATGNLALGIATAAIVAGLMLFFADSLLQPARHLHPAWDLLRVRAAGDPRQLGAGPHPRRQGLGHQP